MSFNLFRTRDQAPFRGQKGQTSQIVGSSSIVCPHAYGNASSIANTAVDQAIYSSGNITEIAGMIYRFKGIVKYSCVTGATLISVGMKRAAAGTTLAKVDVTVQNVANASLIIELNAMVNDVSLNSQEAGSFVIDSAGGTAVLWTESQRNNVIGGGAWSPLFLTLQWGAANAGNVMNPLVGWWEVISPGALN